MNGLRATKCEKRTFVHTSGDPIDVFIRAANSAFGNRAILDSKAGPPFCMIWRLGVAGFVTF